MTSIIMKRPLTAIELVELYEDLDIIPDGIVITPPDDHGDNTHCDSSDKRNNNPGT